MLWTYCGCFIKVKRWRAPLWCFDCLLHCLRSLTVTQTDLMSCGSDMNNEWKHQWGCYVMFLTDGLCSFDSNMKHDFLFQSNESAVSSSVTLTANCIFHCMILITFNPTFSLFLPLSCCWRAKNKIRWTVSWKYRTYMNQCHKLSCMETFERETGR